MASFVGIVLTALWLAGGTLYYATTKQREWLDRSESQHSRCMYQSGSPEAMRRCQQDNAASYERLIASDYWRDSFRFTLMLAVLAWLVIGLVYGALRWILAGRVASNPSSPRND